MNKIEIDYSAIPSGDTSAVAEEGWEAPAHKYFGKKLPNGKMEKEPLYVHQEFPRMMYTQKNGKVSAKIVRNQEELDSLGDGWAKNPIAFGLITAPSFEQLVQAGEPVLEEVEGIQEPARRDRPAKV
jgi:hypothetical protein